MLAPINSADEFAEKLGQALRDRGFHKIDDEQAVHFPRFREDSFKLGPLVDFVKNFRHGLVEIGVPSIIRWDAEPHPMFEGRSDVIEVGLSDLVDPLVLEKSSGKIYEYLHDGGESDRRLVSHSSEWFLAGLLAVAQTPKRFRFESVEQIEALAARLREQESFLQRMTGASYNIFSLSSFDLEFDGDPPIQFLPNFTVNADTMVNRVLYFPVANPPASPKSTVAGQGGWFIRFMDRRCPGYLFAAKYRAADSMLIAKARWIVIPRGRLKQKFDESDVKGMSEALGRFFNSYIE